MNIGSRHKESSKVCKKISFISLGIHWMSTNINLHEIRWRACENRDDLPNKKKSILFIDRRPTLYIHQRGAMVKIRAKYKRVKSWTTKGRNEKPKLQPVWNWPEVGGNEKHWMAACLEMTLTGNVMRIEHQCWNIGEWKNGNNLNWATITTIKNITW